MANKSKYDVNVENEDKERDKIVHDFHSRDDDINGTQLNIMRKEALKKEKKNPADYGYMEGRGYKEHR